MTCPLSCLSTNYCPSTIIDFYAIMSSAEGWKIPAQPPSLPSLPVPGSLLPANMRVGIMSYCFINGVSYFFFFIVFSFLNVSTLHFYSTTTFLPFTMYKPLDRVPFTARPSMVKVPSATDFFSTTGIILRMPVVSSSSKMPIDMRMGAA